MISATMVLASASPHAKPIYTLKLRYPWFIHGEVMTHRVFSRNASSNRAIPLARMLEEVRSDELRAEPVFWGAEQKGMSPGGGVNSPVMASMAWKLAAQDAANNAQRLADMGVHKSLCNRLLMPFTHANVIITATEWDNFFGLRLAADVDPTMRALAEAIWREITESNPVELRPGQWHLPFVSHEDVSDVANTQHYAERPQVLQKISVARCARVSYEAHETGKRSTVEADLRLYDQLSKNGHWSPFEHQATPDEPDTGLSMKLWKHEDEWGNLPGWRQHRKMMIGEALRPLPEEYKK